MQNLKPILTITKKEFKAYFDHPLAYIVLVAFLALNSFFYFRAAFLSNIADLRSMFDMFLWLLMFIVPAITMRLFAEEKQNHTLELLTQQPLPTWQILAGKFLGALGFFKVALLGTLFVPIVLSFYGNFDWGQIIAQYSGSVLLASAMIAVGLFSSTVTKNQIGAFIIGIGIIFVLVISGFDFVLSSITGITKTIFEQLSLSWHFSNIIRGVIDLRDLIYFITITAVFLFVSFWLMIRENVNPKRPLWRQLKIGIMALVMIAVIINLLGLSIHGRLDLTKQNLYTLSSASKDIIKNVPDVVSIDVYRSKEIPPEVSVRMRDVSDLLNDFAAEGGGNLRINYHNIDAENATEAESAGVQAVQFNIVKADEFQVKQGYFGLTISYLDKKEVIPFIEKSDDFEYQLVSLVRKMTNENKQTVGFLSGHQEKSSATDYVTFSAELEKQYEVTDVTFDAEKKELSSKPNILIIAGPSTEVSAEEKEALKKYLQENGKAFLLLDGITLSEQSLYAAKNEFSLGDLLDGYGVKLNNNVVGDLQSQESVSFSSGGYNYVLPYPFWPRTQADKTSTITNQLDSVVLPWPSSLEITDAEKTVKLLSTTAAGGYSQEDNFSLAPTEEVSVAQDKLGEKILALSVSPKEGETGARLVVVGDSDFLTENFIQQGVSGAVFALNAVDWLSQDNALASLRAKQRLNESLVFENDSQKNQVKYLNLVGVPLAVALFGFFQLNHRRKLTKRKYAKSN